MSHEYNEPIYRTSPARVGKMMAIMLGICIVGGVIFFGMWDYWISQVPPVVAGNNVGVVDAAPAQATGKTIHNSLSFIESSDFTKLAFNALPGEPDNNPTISANVGDEIIFDVVNDGKSFHSFGVTQESEGLTGIIPETEIATGINPLKPGESGTSRFVPTAPGEYYYICTVPGHRVLGMVGTIVVGEEETLSSDGDGMETTASTAAAPPTGVTHDFTVDFVESDDGIKLAFNALEGQENHNPDFTVNSGDQVTFTATNAGRSFHAFGITTDPNDLNNVLWGSEIGSMSNLLKPGESDTTTFTAGAPGKYHYICTVPGHTALGMVGSFIVE